MSKKLSKTCLSTSGLWISSYLTRCSAKVISDTYITLQQHPSNSVSAKPARSVRQQRVDSKIVTPQRFDKRTLVEDALGTLMDISIDFPSVQTPELAPESIPSPENDKIQGQSHEQRRPLREDVQGAHTAMQVFNAATIMILWLGFCGIYTYYRFVGPKKQKKKRGILEKLRDCRRERRRRKTARAKKDGEANSQ